MVGHAYFPSTKDMSTTGNFAPPPNSKTVISKLAVWLIEIVIVKSITLHSPLVTDAQTAAPAKFPFLHPPPALPLLFIKLFFILLTTLLSSLSHNAPALLLPLMRLQTLRVYT